MNIWMTESNDIARDYSYKTPWGKQPSEDYIKEGIQICLKRLALAGYRLSDAIVSAYEKATSK